MRPGEHLHRFANTLQMVKVHQLYNVTGPLGDFTVTFHSYATWTWLARHRCRQQRRHWQTRTEQAWLKPISMQLHRETVGPA